MVCLLLLTGVHNLGSSLTARIELFAGDVIYLNVAGQSVIVLNSPKAASDLLFRHAGNYSSRPRNIVGSEIMTGGMFMVLNSCGDL